MPVNGLVTRGWLAVFGAGPHGRLGGRRQTARNNVWSDWEVIGPPISGAPAAYHNPDGRIEVFAVAADERLGHVWETEDGEGWSEWESLGAPLAGDPVVFHNSDGHLELFARGPRDVLGHTWQSGAGHGWAEWAELGPEIAGDPALFQNVDGRLEIFAAGPGGMLGHRWQLDPSGPTGWSEWEELGPEISGHPCLFLNADGRLEIFAIGPGGVLGHRWQGHEDHGWSPWDDLTDRTAGNPVAFQNAGGRLELFARGRDGHLGHMWQTGEGWSEWTPFGPEVKGDPALFQNPDGRLEVFATAADGYLGHAWQHVPDGEHGWSDWVEMGPEMTGRPVVGQIGDAGAPRPREEAATPVAAPSVDLTADVCIIGAGPAGMTMAEGLIRAGAKVVLLESGQVEVDLAAQELNDADAEGPIIKRRLSYLQDSRFRGVQGSATNWGTGWCMPFRPVDYAKRSWVPGSGWPIAGEDLREYEQRAAQTFGFEPFGEPRTEASLVHLAYQFPDDPKLFRRMYLDLLTEPGFQPELGTTAVELTVRGDSVRSVRAVRRDGAEVTVEADTFVLAAGGVENARFLLLQEEVLGTSTVTGQFFMEHPHLSVGSLKLPAPADLRDALEWRSGFEVLALEPERQEAEGLLHAMVQLRRWGGDDRSLDGPIEAELYVRAEQAPNPESRVVLGGRTDRLDCRLPVLRWRVTEQDWTTVLRTAELVAAALEEAHGAEAELFVKPDEPWPASARGPAEADGAAWGNHHLGTTRMGEDPGSSVVDADCRLHGTANLYLAGSSVFPTGGCANPTFTIVALAHRLVDHLTAKS